MRVIISRNTRLMGNVARMGTIKNAFNVFITRTLREQLTPKTKALGRIILKFFLYRVGECGLESSGSGY
jgi:hypothetical protein